MNKTYIWAIILAGAIVIVGFFMNNDKSNENRLEEYLTSPTPETSLVPVPTPTSTPVKQSKPTPGIILEEVPNYDKLVEVLQEFGRHLAIAPDCSYIAPSNIDYYNNTKVMLDNTASDVQHILKIGGREYLLEAGQWILVTLSSPNLPAKLPIYCGQIELGQIDLLVE